MDNNKMMELGFQIIAFSGDAKSQIINAIKLAKEGNVEQANLIIKQANEFIGKAHSIQTELITEEARGNFSPPPLIMVHAQDHLMNTILLKDLSSTILDLYTKIK